ncbi:GNAT family N-acetyltransferase [Cryomorpha ignava]|uniref:GNAT family N-acetyltransferase n=1 Tax=Cryomorpha ignava TaxID=101383 RepID=A0A7K3WQC0_9FLAO|nr:GNAT family N-acetyltransferase [Cryomorpha ignava]NEN23746.1 GNAT family N-acetyltransferase [Cryomorpha ignava]
MIIRQATKADSEVLTILIMLALEAMVYEFIAEKNFEKGIAFLSHFTKSENNQYSYQNCFVAEVNGAVVGAVNAYDGAHLDVLRKPVLDFVFKTTGRAIKVGDETQEGELYIDTLGVNPNYQGLGIGSALVNHLIDKIVVQKRQTLGLLVDVDNPKARKLYLKLGFKSVGYKTLFVKELEHLQISPKAN